MANEYSFESGSDNPLGELIKAMGLLDGASATQRQHKEASGLMRSAAASNFDFYVAHLQAGFTEEQTMQLLCNWNSATVFACFQLGNDDGQQ